MPALLDALDRFNYTASSIRSLTNSQPRSRDPGPFTAAILHLTPQDLLRDGDDSEYGLFTFAKESSDAPVEPLGRVGRREFKGATPLRRKRVAGAGASKDEEPEVYVEAALKYLYRFHAVKPMPQAQTHLESLVDRLNSVRDNLERLETSLEEATQSGRASPKSQAIEEERRISELKSRILQLRKRKDALSSKLPAKSKQPVRTVKSGLRPIQTKPNISSPSNVFDSPSSALSTPTSQASQPKAKAKSRLIPTAQGRSRVSGPPKGKSIPRRESNSSTGDGNEGERLFWSGGKPLKLDTGQSSSLLDESFDMSGMDALMSPPPPMSSSNRVPKTPEAEDGGDGGPSADEADLADDRSAGEDDEDSDSGEPTVVLSKIAPVPAPAPPTAPPSPPPSRPLSQASVPEPQTPAQNGKEPTVPPSTKTKVKRVRVTAEVERICAKIWSAIPDLLVPGNNFSSPGKKPPTAKDTLAVLQTISSQPIPDPSAASVSSPSTRSTLSSLLGIETLGAATGSPHQIMTAHVLLSLLTAPNHAVPLTALKALLASKTAVPLPGPDAGREAKQSAAAMGASAAQAGTRALYGCVAKKLVKIDRGGGEQIVKFD